VTPSRRVCQQEAMRSGHHGLGPWSSAMTPSPTLGGRCPRVAKGLTDSCRQGGNRWLQLGIACVPLWCD